MNRGIKITLISIMLIIAAAVVIFFPLKVRSRLLLDHYRGMNITGSANYYIEDDNDFNFEIRGNDSTNLLLDWLASLSTVRSFKNVETPLVYSDRMYTINIVNQRTYEKLKIVTNGRYMEIHEGGRHRKYRIIPKDFDMEELDAMVSGFIEKGYGESLTPIEFEDISDSYHQEWERPSGWLDMEFLDAHAGDYYYAIFYDVRPYESLEIYDDGSSMVVFYNEGEGEQGDVELSLSSLPHSKIYYYLNGERCFDVRYEFSME